MWIVQSSCGLHSNIRDLFTIQTSHHPNFSSFKFLITTTLYSISSWSQNHWMYHRVQHEMYGLTLIQELTKSLTLAQLFQKQPQNLSRRCLSRECWAPCIPELCDAPVRWVTFSDFAIDPLLNNLVHDYIDDFNSKGREKQFRDSLPANAKLVRGAQSMAKWIRYRTSFTGIPNEELQWPSHFYQ